MENHPIPQDVTGFKFKLIGSITVKQFLYLLGFGILATVAFVLPANFLFVRVPLMVLFGGIGAALAFLPIEGRPLDVMIANFARTIPAENRYIFRKRGANLSMFDYLKPPLAAHAQAVQNQQQAVAKDAKDNAEDKRAMLISRLRNSAFRPDEGETRVLNNVHTLFEGKTPSVNAYPAKPASPLIQNAEQAAVTEMKEDPRPQVEPPEQAQQVAQPPQETTKQESETAAPATQNLNLGTEQSHDAPKETAAPQAIAQAPNPALTGGFPTLPDIGNVVLGIVRDPRAKTLPSVLVEVIDANNIPVRAFKTNAFGQFASATPLSNGKYTVVFDDPNKQHEFSPVSIDLTGEIFQPLIVTSIDAREKLRRELFGAPQAASA